MIKNLLMFSLVLVGLNASAYELAKITTSKKMPHLEAAIKSLCSHAQQSCYTKVYKVTQINNNGTGSELLDDILDNEIASISNESLIEQYVTQIAIELLSKNASQMPKLKRHVAAMSQDAHLKPDLAVIGKEDNINTQLYKLATKGGIYFYGGKTYSPFGDHSVLVVVRLSADRSEGEVMTWDTGYSE